MGLDTTHNCWRGSYHGFGMFRCAVAKAAKIPLALMRGFVGDMNLMGAPQRLLDCIPIEWEVLRPDPIHTLLNHSDCDGEIAASDCGPLADRLEELLPLIPDCEVPGMGPDGWRSRARQFIDGLRLAAAAGEAVEFN